jgi:glycosyltransferase involved in cell wall biosynthesis
MSRPTAAACDQMMSVVTKTMTPRPSGSPRICVVAENASFRFGGEASLPLHYFRRLRSRGLEAWLVVHERNRAELSALLTNDTERIYFTADTWLQRLIWRLNRWLSNRAAEALFGTLMALVEQWIQRKILRELIAKYEVNIVHQPIPVSPRAPSFIFKLGVPVVIGPMNGGMEYPPAFRTAESRFTHISVAVARRSANLINCVIPGKMLAEIMLVANERTRRVLPTCVRGVVVEIPENGVDLDLWSTGPKPSRRDPPCFIFIGRLVNWKRLDLVLHALVEVPEAHFQVIGDGIMRHEWTALTASLGLSSRVSFTGWLSQDECAQRLRSATALVLPSIYECGGAVVLEAMATLTPVIATAWGGPADYLDETCGILVPPSSAQAMIDGFARAMRTLIESPHIAQKLGQAGRRKVEAYFSWDTKMDQVVEVYRQAIERRFLLSHSG